MTQNQIKSQFFPPHKKKKKICFIVFLPEGEADVFPLTHRQKASCLCCHNFILSLLSCLLRKSSFSCVPVHQGPPHTGARGCVPFPVQSLAVSCGATFAKSRPHWRCVAGIQTSVSPVGVSHVSTKRLSSTGTDTWSGDVRGCGGKKKKNPLKLRINSTSVNRLHNKRFSHTN